MCTCYQYSQRNGSKEQMLVLEMIIDLDDQRIVLSAFYSNFLNKIERKCRKFKTGVSWLLQMITRGVNKDCFNVLDLVQWKHDDCIVQCTMFLRLHDLNRNFIKEILYRSPNLIQRKDNLYVFSRNKIKFEVKSSRSLLAHLCNPFYQKVIYFS